MGTPTRDRRPSLLFSPGHDKRFFLRVFSSEGKYGNLGGGERRDRKNKKRDSLPPPPPLGGESLFDSSSFSSRWEGGIPIPLSSSSSSSSSVRKRPVASILGSKLRSPFAPRFILRSILDLCLLANDHGGRKKKENPLFPSLIQPASDCQA